MTDPAVPVDPAPADLKTRFQAGVRRITPSVNGAWDGVAVTTTAALIAGGLAPLVAAGLVVGGWGHLDLTSPLALWLTQQGGNALSSWLGSWGQQRIARHRPGDPPPPPVTAAELAAALSPALGADRELMDAAVAVLQSTEALAVAVAELPTRAEQRALLEALAADFHRTQNRQTVYLSNQLADLAAGQAPLLPALQAILAQLHAAPATSAPAPSGPAFYGPVNIYGGVAGGNIGTIQTAPGLNSALSTQHSELRRTNLPYRRNASFVGRADEIAAVTAALAAGRAVAVTGTGGLGKTQLAVEVAGAAVEAGTYPGGVWWVPMAAPDAVAGRVAALGGPDGLALPGWQEGQPDANRALVQRAWATPTVRLLIFDNLEDPQLWQQWRPAAGSGCRVLITARRGQWSHRSGVQAVPLSPLAGAESRELLLAPRAMRQQTSVAALLAEGVTADAADAIVAAVGGLPLALALAAIYLEENTGVSVARYRTLLAAQIVAHPSLNDALIDDLPTGHAPSIAATFALSYDQLDPAAPTDALALRLLHAAAAAAPEPIPRRLLYRAEAANPAEDDPLPPEQADPALARLSALGLLDELPDTALRLHRLLAAYVQTRPQPGDDAALRLEAALNAEVYAINMAGYPLAGTPYLPHLRHAAAAAADPRGDAAAAALLTNLAYLLEAQGDYAAARPLFERALAIREATLGPHHPTTAQSLNNLAYLLEAQGDYAAARPLFERALAIREATLGPHHPDTALSLNNLAALLDTQGDYVAARPLYERALAIREAALGPRHPDTAQSLNNLAELLRAQGDYVAARPLYERALAIREAALGPRHPDTAQSLNNLAALLRAQGDYAAARPLFERALAIYEATLGPTHPDTAMGLNNLAALLDTQGDYVAARPLYDRAVAIGEQALGPDHPDTRLYRANRDALVWQMDAASGA